MRLHLATATLPFSDFLPLSDHDQEIVVQTIGAGKGNAALVVLSDENRYAGDEAATASLQKVSACD
ncbi:hypothetical protein JIR23_22085 [Bradyrhizobium diazoefficiens]|nr:hypothetical protein [Bradyrhizobium diazoefficiens]QQN62272.1 hypothetical protein JIR23_22085 [Bradyrhizobium diazoefficiens]